MSRCRIDSARSSRSGDLLASEEAATPTHPLDVPIGRDISGKTLVANLGEMPHVLISGATGRGQEFTDQLHRHRRS